MNTFLLNMYKIHLNIKGLPFPTEDLIFFLYYSFFPNIFLKNASMDFLKPFRDDRQ